MILYHGSDIDITSIDLSKCKLGKDFGRGFYLTESIEKAMSLAIRTAKIRKSSPIVNAFSGPDFKEINTLKIKIFPKTDVPWARFVYNNREVEGFSHDYDVVIGPTADDTMRYLFGEVANGMITFEELAKKLIYKKEDIQYCLCSETAIKTLQKI